MTTCDAEIEGYERDLEIAEDERAICIEAEPCRGCGCQPRQSHLGSRLFCVECPENFVGCETDEEALKLWNLRYGDPTASAKGDEDGPVEPATVHAFEISRATDYKRQP